MARSRHKKLREAVRFFYEKKSDSHTTLADDLKAFGIPVPDKKEDDAPTFTVFDENESALEVFLSMATQWQWAGMSGEAVGLNYSSLAVVMKILKVEDESECLWRIRVMEDEALKVMGERRSGSTKV